ncbi:MAG: diaminopimelate decarboxylase [Vulcanimicrobiaceae bacterium]
MTTTDALFGQRFGGVAPHELAHAYGTPLLVIDTDVLDENVARFERARAEFDIDVCYAGKALLVVALARRIAASTLGLDVCSLGELLTGEAGGVPAERMVLHGCGKTDEELRAALDGRVGRTIVDHHDELRRLHELARGREPSPTPLRILLRVNTGIEARTHAYVRTGGESSKFGFPLRELDAAIEAALAIPGTVLAGIHTHLGSQIFDGEAYAASVPILADAYRRVVALGARGGELVVGGGFGVDSRPGGERIDTLGVLRELAAAFRARFAHDGIAPPRIGIEPGRALVADAGSSLYRVVAIKTQGERRFAIVDGGIADNPRPALYGAYHHPALAGRTSDAEPIEFTVCGRSCENDRLVVARLPADLATGDLLGLATTGAYTFSMASNYNRFAKPAVAFAGAGAHRLVVRRQTAGAVLADDVLDA